MKKLLFIAAFVVLSSCTYHDQRVQLDLVIYNEKSDIGLGKGIDLRTFDDRLNPSILGNKEFCDDEKILLTSNQNLTELVKDRISKNLSAKGFTKGNDKIVEVAIKELKYTAKCQFVIGKSEANVLIKVSVTDTKTSTKVTKNFELVVKNKHLFRPLAATDVATINDLLGEVLQDILTDDILTK